MNVVTPRITIVAQLFESHEIKRIAFAAKREVSRSHELTEASRYNKPDSCPVAIYLFGEERKLETTGRSVERVCNGVLLFFKKTELSKTFLVVKIHCKI